MKIDIAYGGSCTGGKKADMDMYARVLAGALASGERVAPGVHLYLQFGSQDIRRYADDKGYLEVFEQRGRRARRPVVRRVHQGGSRLERLAEPGDGERAEPQLPRPQRPGEGVPREPARRRRERDRREDRASPSVMAKSTRNVVPAVRTAAGYLRPCETPR